MTTSRGDRDLGTQDGEILADLFDELLQEILEGRTPDLASYLPDRPDLRDRVARTWSLACSVAGRREAGKPVLGGYEILRELGHGGMGTVYLAQHEILQREVAIKVLPHSLAMSPLAKQRFLEEAKALARIRHAHVVHIHRVLDHTEMLAFEMEFINGPSLQQVVRQLRTDSGPPTTASLAAAIGVAPIALGAHNPIEWFVRAGIKIARALGETHRHGLVHRDVKPSNILLRSDGTPVLADFGLARLEELGSGHSGDFAGTPVYAAPERLRGGDSEVGPPTDIYSLGVTLYELLTLSPPFSGTSTHEVLRRLENGNLPDLRQQAPHVSRDLATVVQKAMEADPRHRYATADEFADDLERLLNFEPIRARPAGLLRRGLKLMRRNRRVVTAGIIGAMLVAGIAWPVVAHAQSISAAQLEAGARLQAARTQLLSPESLHTAWTMAFAGASHQPLQHPGTRAAHFQALRRVVAGYDRVLALQPDDRAAELEHDAVAAALHIIGSRGGATPEPLPAEEHASPLLAAVAARALDRSDVALPLATASNDERFAAGLLAFLIGDPVASRSCWRDLGRESGDRPMLDACEALQLSNEGFSDQAYPRLFHATRAFPDASALALAMAGSALEIGNPGLAEAWLSRSSNHDDNPIVATRRRLLEADLLTANRKLLEAAGVYRELSAHDVSDPRPRQRLAALALFQGNTATGRRLLSQILARWPEQALSRLQLAQVELQQRRLGAYLAHVRYVLALDLARLPPATASQLTALVRYGGFGDLLTTTIDTPHHSARGLTDLPVSNWLPATACDAIRTALRAVAAFDRAHDAMQHVDPRPVGVALRATWLAALSLPALTESLPTIFSMALVAGIPALLGAPTDYASSLLLPFQKILGNQAHIVEPDVIVPFGTEPATTLYVARAERARDLDGDTLEDFCTTHLAATEHSERNRVELRAVADGALLRTLRGGGEPVVFGSSLAVTADFDGDRCNDLLIGSPAVRTSGTLGMIELRSGRTGERLWSRAGTAADFGEALALVGDHNGDGHADIVVGAPTVDGPAGSAVLCSGASGAVLLALPSPPEAGPGFGAVVVDAGDVDADGCRDGLVTGNPGNAAGCAVVYSGRDGRILATFAEPSALEDFGTAAVGLGDINADGHADFAIAAPAYTGRAQRPGRVLVLDGKTGRLLYELRGERHGESFGFALCALPYWRADARPALAVSAFRGGPTGAGYVRVFDAATGQPLQTLAANPSVRLFGNTLVDLGDRDGDGLRDLGVPLVLADDTCGMWSVSFALTLVR